MGGRQALQKGPRTTHIMQKTRVRRVRQHLLGVRRRFLGGSVLGGDRIQSSLRGVDVLPRVDKGLVRADHSFPGQRMGASGVADGLAERGLGGHKLPLSPAGLTSCNARRRVGEHFRGTRGGRRDGRRKQRAVGTVFFL